MRKISLLIGLLLLVLFAVPSISQNYVSSQEPVAPLPSINTDTSSEGEEVQHSQEEVDQQNAELAAIEADVSSRDIRDYRSAYFISSNVAQQPEVASAEAITEIMGSTIVSTWEELLAENAIAPFQIILLHRSVYEQIDTSWTQAAYRNGIILVGIDLEHEELSNITGDLCLQELNPTFRGMFKSTFLYFTYHVKLQNESYREFINEAELRECVKDSEVLDLGGSQAYIYHGVRNYPLESIEDVQHMVHALLGVTYNYGFPNPRFNDNLIGLPK